ncbi:SDR family NAD(P)-dependent oxidoreductase [Sphingomonas japonica]|uniref:NAD(P)-dependent dehydrogenase (Short-subunit alcohol dehydrogenase family) n=1 Tax=Sphingomonas japonica TaxID=511662 RepID=A0ABX0U150_9SPHN|nr:SDR family oxidoreductase [Sphingomonas japonica]NIJ23036.1 NAD(P)-dependent dehydrogenase (short-subunit alcohol dehydrogenase family) [Sphingomonas japonica]
MAEADPNVARSGAEPSQQAAPRAVYPSLAGKRVLVTGGGSGIGAGIVEGFVAQGADVTFLDIAREDSAALVERLAPAPVRFECVDLTRIADLQAIVAQSIERHGAFDVLVNNAANDDRHSIDEISESYWDDRFAVNLKHMFFCTQAVIPAMRAAGGGAIVNLGSISWHLGLSDLTLYQTCKAAIEGLTRSLARDLGHDGIRATCVIPGNVRTPRQQKWYTPEGEAEIVAAQCLKGRLLPHDIAAMVMFLASDDARLITGHSYFVDAGWR